MVMLPALLASVFSQQSNLLRIEIFNLLIPLQPICEDVSEIYHRLAVISWSFLNFVKAIVEALCVVKGMRNAKNKSFNY